MAEWLNTFKRGVANGNGHRSVALHCLVAPPIREYVNFDLPFVVFTDVSDMGLKKTEEQGGCPGVWSWILNRGEGNYYAVLLALQWWRYYLEWEFFTVFTDNSTLLWVLDVQTPSACLQGFTLRNTGGKSTTQFQMPCPDDHMTWPPLLPIYHQPVALNSIKGAAQMK